MLDWGSNVKQGIQSFQMKNIGDQIGSFIDFGGKPTSSLV
jgi:hypothetical protein